MKSTSTPEYRKLIDRLKRARTDSELTQQELARRLRKPQSYVSKFENGERRLDVAEFIEIAEALGTSIDVLIPRPKRKRASSK